MRARNRHSREPIIETVARRGALLARARLQLNHTDDHAAQLTLAEVERLPKSEYYLGQLNQIRVLAVEEAQKRKDRVGERRIAELCQKTLDRITQYLPDDRIAAFKDELARLVERKTVKLEQDNAPMRRDQTPTTASSADRAEGAASLRRTAPQQPAPLSRGKKEAASEKNPENSEKIPEKKKSKEKTPMQPGGI